MSTKNPQTIQKGELTTSHACVLGYKMPRFLMALLFNVTENENSLAPFDEDKTKKINSPERRSKTVLCTMYQTWICLCSELSDFTPCWQKLCKCGTQIQNSTIRHSKSRKN